MAVDVRYFDIRNRSDAPYQFFLGGRGIGKTYSALSACVDCNDAGGKWLWSRRGNRELEMITSVAGNVWKKYDKNESTLHLNELQAKTGIGLCRDEEDNILGYYASLATFSNTRGADYSDVTLWIHDEFVPERASRIRIADEGFAFLNMYETINRNREVEGQPPLRVICLSNSTTIANSIFFELGLVKDVTTMAMTGRNVYRNDDRGVYVELVGWTDIAEQKRETSLYKLTKNTRFYKQAIDNEFTDDPLYLIKKVQISQYKPVLSFGKVTIYSHKSNGTYYARTARDSATKRFEEWERKEFSMMFKHYYRMMLGNGAIFFDTLDTKMYIESAFE